MRGAPSLGFSSSFSAPPGPFALRFEPPRQPLRNQPMLWLRQRYAARWDRLRGDSLTARRRLSLVYIGTERQSAVSSERNRCLTATPARESWHRQTPALPVLNEGWRTRISYRSRSAKSRASKLGHSHGYRVFTTASRPSLWIIALTAA